MSKVTPRTPSGFNEYLPADQIEFNRLLDIIRATYEKYGFSPIDTPDIELSEVLLAKAGGETEQQIYRFTRGKNDLSLRFDLTVPLARYAAEHEGELVFPFRRYHIGKVHRGERAQAGRFRELYQCDIDVIGSESPLTDAEFPAIINEIFTQLNFGEFTIRVNNRKVLNGFLEAIGAAHLAGNVLHVIDKMEKISADETITELRAAGLTDEQVEQVLNLVNTSGSNDDVLASLRNQPAHSELFDEGLAELTILVDALRSLGVPESRFRVDPKIVRGLDYYTGTVYETFLNDYPELGSVCSGGRYDDLASNYTDTKLAGVGISIGLSRLFYKLREIGVIQPTRQTPANVVVMPFTEAQIPAALQTAASLRAAGVATLLYTEPNNLKQKLRYADRMGFTYAALIGEKEAVAGTVSLKNMTTGESTEVPAGELAQQVVQY